MLQLPNVLSEIRSRAADTKAISLLAETRLSKQEGHTPRAGEAGGGNIFLFGQGSAVFRVRPASRLVPCVSAEFHSHFFCHRLQRTGVMHTEDFCRIVGGGSHFKEKDSYFKGHAWCLSVQSEGPAVRDPLSVARFPCLCFPFPSCFGAGLLDYPRFPIRAQSSWESWEVCISDHPGQSAEGHSGAGRCKQ